MTSSGSYNIHDRNANTEIQRLAAQACLGWEKESRTLSWFGLKDRMSILELGSGPGFITQQLLALTPQSTITCLEIQSARLKQAEQYLQPPAKDRVHFVEGSIMDMQFPDNSFDFAYARLLFQHLPDPIGAAKETWRVLKPGGKFVIYDIDDDIFGLMEPTFSELPKVLEQFGEAQAARGGNRHVGRKLWRILNAANFSNLDLEVIAAHSTNEGIEPFLPQIDPNRLLFLVKEGRMSSQEIESIRNSHAKFLASPEPYILLLSLMVCGEKPRAPIS
jgi:ubiquinone/menaquinone biosynthesis C-methylase UbiE